MIKTNKKAIRKIIREEYLRMINESHVLDTVLHSFREDLHSYEDISPDLYKMIVAYIKAAYEYGFRDGKDY